MWTKFLFKQIDLLFNIPQNTFRNIKCTRILKNQVYYDQAPKYCTLDIYCMKNLKDTKCPVFINIHGGGFVAGDKYYRRSFCSYMATKGFKVININYGLCPEHRYPEFIDHSARAVKWCEENAEQYNLDMAKVIISGDSAGAYIAQCLCVCSTDENYRKSLDITAFDTKFLGSALFCGPFMPTRAFKQAMAFNVNHLLWTDLTGEILTVPEDIEKYKYYKQIDCGNFANKDFPSCLITHSEHDIFCKGHAQDFINLLRENNISVLEIHSLDDMHDWHEILGIRSSRTTLALFNEFLIRLLGDNLRENKHIRIDIKHGKIINKIDSFDDETQKELRKINTKSKPQ